MNHIKVATQVERLSISKFSSNLTCSKSNQKASIVPGYPNLHLRKKCLRRLRATWLKRWMFCNPWVPSWRTRMKQLSEIATIKWQLTIFCPAPAWPKDQTGTCGFFTRTETVYYVYNIDLYIHAFCIHTYVGMGSIVFLAGNYQNKSKLFGVTQKFELRQLHWPNDRWILGVWRKVWWSKNTLTCSVLISSMPEHACCNFCTFWSQIVPNCLEVLVALELKIQWPWSLEPQFKSEFQLKPGNWVKPFDLRETYDRNCPNEILFHEIESRKLYDSVR